MDCKPTRINELFTGANEPKPPEMLFDAFLMSGELTILCGPHGSGKSLLAIQIAEALARRRQIWNFAMPEERARKVLYVDLVASKAQFTRRYVSPERYRRPRERTYKFSNNLFQVRPGDELDGFDKWLRTEIEDGGYEVIMIDDLAALRRAVETPRMIARLVRRLKRICDELDVSVLLLATTETTDEKAPLRRQMIFDSADSIFAVGITPSNNDRRYFVQTRSRNRRVVWNSTNAPVATIGRSDDGFLGFEFDHRTGPQLDSGQRSLICRLHAMSIEGKSLRQIERETGISFSKVSRLIKKWSPFLQKQEEEAHAELERRWREDEALRLAADAASEEAMAAAVEDQDEELDKLDEAGIERPPGLESEHSATADSTHWSNGVDVTQIPFMAALKRRTIYDLEHRVDEYGRDVYVETACDVTGRPKISYRYDSKGNLDRWKSDMWGSIATHHLGKTIFIWDG